MDVHDVLAILTGLVSHYTPGDIDILEHMRTRVVTVHDRMQRDYRHDPVLNYFDVNASQPLLVW
jgi:hypothetical protein